MTDAVLNRMVDLIKKCEIYSLNENSLIYKELCAYSVGINLVKNYLEEILRECFISTAVTFGLSNYQQLFDIDLSQLELNNKREILNLLNSRQKGTFDFSLFTTLMDLSDNNYYAQMALDGKILHVDNYEVNNRIQISKIDSLVCGNASIALKTDFSSFGQCWDTRDKSNYSFNFLDKNPISFNTFDTEREV